MEEKKWITNLDLVAIVVVGVLALAVLILQVLNINDETTELETGLFNILQFILSFGFAWLLTRLVTKREFQENLEQFAISAYRRIRDIDVSLVRMRREIDQMRARYSKDGVHELDVLKVIASDMADTVRSSIGDWADVIGEDLRKQQRLKQLEESYAAATLASQRLTANGQPQESRSDIASISAEIEHLRLEIPEMLAYDSGRPLNSYESPELIETALTSAAAIQGELLLYAEAQPELSWDDLKALKTNQPLSLHPARAMHSFYFPVLEGSIHDEDYRTLGELVNPYSRLGIDDIEFYIALLAVLTPYVPIVAEGFRDIDNIPVSFVGLSPSNRNQFIVRFEARDD